MAIIHNCYRNRTSRRWVDKCEWSTADFRSELSRLCTIGKGLIVWGSRSAYSTNANTNANTNSHADTDPHGNTDTYSDKYTD